MFNFKIAGIAAVLASAVSLALGIINGISMAALLIRAGLFAGLFFALACLVFWLVNQFLPELLSPGEDDLDIPAPGSHVDVTVGSAEGAFPTDSSDTVDNIGGSVYAGAVPPEENAGFSGMDQEEDIGYNSDGALSGGPESFDAEAAAPKDGLPDMDGFSEAYSQAGRDAAAAVEAIAFETDGPRRPLSSGSDKSGMAGDFNPKDLAQAIRTVLKKDEKG
ncbi:MAG: hypothetical protein LBB82_10820 [Treponema sp.]|nr:hypothetical protein [Treponema sp.]